MTQQYIPYWEWEDWIYGMWRKVHNEDYFLKLAVKFTGDHVRYGSAMKEVVYAWPRTMVNSLTNPSINKRAFLGHCACCFKIKCPEYIVRRAWKLLTNEQRYLADKVAQETIDEWKIKYDSILPNGNKGVILTAYQMRLL